MLVMPPEPPWAIPVSPEHRTARRRVSTINLNKYAITSSVTNAVVGRLERTNHRVTGSPAPLVDPACSGRAAWAK